VRRQVFGSEPVWSLSTLLSYSTLRDLVVVTLTEIASFDIAPAEQGGRPAARGQPVAAEQSFPLRRAPRPHTLTKDPAEKPRS
jgi:hypothetical protein